jgi:hypothetical protein
VFHPVAFFVSNYVVNFISALIFVALFLGVFFEIIQTNNLPIIPTLSSAGFSTLLHAFGSALVFDLLTKRFKLPHRFIYSFWFYIFGLSWIGPLLGFFILSFLLLPFAIFGYMLRMGMELVQAVFFPEATLVPIISNIYSGSTGTLGILIASVGAIYVFLVIPWRVFNNIFQKEGFSTEHLGIIILASLLIPLPVMFFLFFTFPFLIPG